MIEVGGLKADPLEDFAANEIGWSQMLAALEKAHATYLHRAAKAKTHEEHLLEQGHFEGIEQAQSLIAQIRKQNGFTRA